MAALSDRENEVQNKRWNKKWKKEAKAKGRANPELYKDADTIDNGKSSWNKK